MKKIILSGLLIATTLFLCAQAQKKEYSFTPQEAGRIVKVLASNEMEGRKIYTAGIEKAADFIESEFRDIGLHSMEDGTDKYRQTFKMIRSRLLTISAKWNGAAIEAKHIVAISCQQELSINKSSGYDIKYIKAGANLQREASQFMQPKNNTVVLVDESFANAFGRLNNLARSYFKTDKNLVFVLTNQAPEDFVIEAQLEITEQQLSNVIGILPGKSKKDELVIFSAHYDHLGIRQGEKEDSIFNGANDNATGTAAMIMLARYFRKMKNNERTLVFVAFTAEEAGGYGSRYFSRQLDQDKIVAMFNLEMIGTESKWGGQSAYITGFEKSNMGEMLQKNLEHTPFKFYPDPYPDQQLFYRSDNATLARLGVPAHTISTSQMDKEPHYHKASDHAETLDMKNMATIVQAIALSARTIISGKETPSRVRVEELR